MGHPTVKEIGRKGLQEPKGTGSVRGSPRAGWGAHGHTPRGPAIAAYREAPTGSPPFLLEGGLSSGSLLNMD